MSTWSFKTLDKNPATQVAMVLAQLTNAQAHLCPRQILGVRMGLLAAKILELDVPRHDQRLYTLAETDGCFAKGLVATTNSQLGLFNYGKVAATFIDRRARLAIRILPQPDAKQRVIDFASGATSAWNAMVLGYQKMPDNQLFIVQHIDVGKFEASALRVNSHSNN